MINIDRIRDIIQNKNFIMFFSAIIFMCGILSFFQDCGVFYSIILTILLIAVLYFRLFSIRKVLIFALIFYFGFFLTFCKNKNSDELLPITPAEVTCVGRVVSIPTDNAGKSKFFFQVEKVNSQKVQAKTFVTVSDNFAENKDLNIGNVLEIKGRLRAPFTSTNPSQFDYSKYLRNFNAFTVLYSTPDKVAYKRSELPFRWKMLQSLNNTRNRILKIHSNYLKSPSLEILGGIVFGDDAVTPPDDIKTSFINSGLLHILAASGMNVAFIFTFCFVILKFCRVPYKPRVFVGMIVVILYTFMTGLGASVVRASLMLLFVLCGKLLDRDSHNVSLLSFVAMLMLVYNPAYINDVSFQLSFFVTLGLLTTANVLSKKLGKIPDWIKAPVLIPIVAQVWVAPIQMFYFNTFTAYSVFANIIAAPLLSVISFSGFITSLLLLIPKITLPICAVVDFLLNYLLILLVNISTFFGNLKYSLLQTPHPSIFQLIIYYLILLLGTILLKYDKYKYFVLTVGTLLVILIGSMVHFPSKALEVIAFDVQNADSFLIKTPQNKYFMIDTGKYSYGSTNSQAKIIMLKYLKDRGIKNLEGLIVTHFDNDHSGGTVDILEGTKTKRLYLNSKDTETQTAKKIFKCVSVLNQNYSIVKNDEVIYAEPDLTIKTFKAHMTGKNMSNENSTITLLSYKKFDVLFMGDADAESFKYIAKYMPRNVEVLKVGHHGGPKVVDDEMLNVINPQISLISTGVNYFGHPNKGTLDVLRNTKILRTDLLHSIKFSSDGNLYQIFTYNPHSKKYEIKEKILAK